MWNYWSPISVAVVYHAVFRKTLSSMKLKEVRIRDFKHFSDLTVQNIPETAKLIVLVGPNGCGKSSFIEALHTWHGWASGVNRRWDIEYHVKAGTALQGNQVFREQIKVAIHGKRPAQSEKMVYVRSAYRNDPDFRAKGISSSRDHLSEVRVKRLIDNDATVARNYERLVGHAVWGIFGGGNGSETLDSFRDRVLGDIRSAFSELFPELTIDGLGNPLEDGTFRLSKGTSIGYSYKNLSGGEKAAFDLILDFIVAIRAFDDTVFCIDEPEAHMNARLQSRLLSVLYGFVPANCQLIIATHSIGMMRKARDIELESPGTVAFLDFSDRCFDNPETMEPTKPSRAFWEKAYDVALDDLAALVAPKSIVICEGEPLTDSPVPNHSHDARCYEQIFGAEFPETRFVSMGNVHEIIKDKRGLAATLGLLVGGIEVIKLIDRDDLSPGEVADFEKKRIRVLTRRNLESYLYDDEVLRELAKSVHQQEKVDELLGAKGQILEHRRNMDFNDAPDDLKRASGEIYIKCKKILRLIAPGNGPKGFMRDTLAPLVHPGMNVYLELKQDIFGSL